MKGRKHTPEVKVLWVWAEQQLVGHSRLAERRVPGEQTQADARRSRPTSGDTTYVPEAVAPTVAPIPVASVRQHQRQGETVVALAPHSLHLGGAHPLFGCHHLVEPARSLNSRIRIRGVNDRTGTHDVVDNDQAPWARQPQSPLEVVGVVGLVRVDEHHVERPGAFGNQLGETVQCLPRPYRHEVRQASPLEVEERHLRVSRLELKGDEAAICGQRPRQPDGAVATQGPDLEDLAGALDAGQQVEQLALVWRHVYGG